MTFHPFNVNSITRFDEAFFLFRLLSTERGLAIAYW